MDQVGSNLDSGLVLLLQQANKRKPLSEDTRGLNGKDTERPVLVQPYAAMLAPPFSICVPPMSRL